MISTANLLKVLNGLVQTNKDAVEGFEMAAEHVQDASITQIFEQYAAQRRQFMTELEAFVTEHGGQPNESSSTLGSLHRGWINFKTSIANNEEVAILTEVERGENAAINNYKDALQHDLPDSVRTTVQSQLHKINEALDRVKSIEMTV